MRLPGGRFTPAAGVVLIIWLKDISTFDNSLRIPAKMGDDSGPKWASSSRLFMG
jgi:hypothetical protein